MEKEWWWKIPWITEIKYPEWSGEVPFIRTKSKRRKKSPDSEVERVETMDDKVNVRSKVFIQL